MTTSSSSKLEEEEGSLEVSRSSSDSLDLSTIIKTEVNIQIKQEEEEGKFKVSTIATETDSWL